MAVNGFQLVKTLIIAYVITAVLLLLTAFGLYRLHLSDWQVMAAVVIIYALSCFAGGYILAKAQKSIRMFSFYLSKNSVENAKKYYCNSISHT